MRQSSLNVNIRIDEMNVQLEEYRN